MYSLTMNGILLTPLMFVRVQVLEEVKHELVQTQVNVFLEHRDDDAEEFSHRYDNVRLEFKYPFGD